MKCSGLSHRDGAIGLAGGELHLDAVQHLRVTPDGAKRIASVVSILMVFVTFVGSLTRFWARRAWLARVPTFVSSRAP